MKYCIHHAGAEAVTECASCGKPLCVECIEVRDKDGAFCYDCAIERQLSQFRDKEEAEKAVAPSSAGEPAKGVSLAFKIFASILALFILATAGFLLYFHLSKEAAAETSSQQELVWNRDECMLTMQEVRTALDAYRQDHDTYPASLRELEEGYLDIEAACPLTGAPYVYDGSGVGYRLSCPNPQEHGASEVEAGEAEIPHYTPDAAERGD